MKKSFFLFWFSTILSLSFAQDYQCLKAHVEYTFSDADEMKIIYIDTVILDGGNQVYLNFQSFVDSADQYYCISPKGPSWIGRKMVINPDGDNIFYNRNDEPVTIKPYKNINENWNCYDFDNGDYVKATVAEKSELQFIGLTDTIKKITFQAYNNSGNPITHPINSKFIQVSKAYGLINTLNFRNFPDLSTELWGSGCHEFNLVGLSNPDFGIHNLTVDEVYNFEPGDEIHENKYYTWWNSYNSFDEWRYKKFILDKQFSPSLDSVFLTVNKCGLVRWKHFNGFGYDTGRIYSNDTIIIAYSIAQNELIDTYPEIFIMDTPDSWYNSYNTQNYFGSEGRRVKYNNPGFMLFEPPTDCFFHYLTELNDFYFYIEGLGGPYYEESHTYDYYSYYKPVYYKKGNEEWGTPWTFDCDSLPTSINNDAPNKSNITITPNPMKEMTRISIDSPVDENFSISIYNIMGEEVYEHIFRAGEIIISRSELSKGIYVIKISDPNSVLAIRKLIVE